MKTAVRGLERGVGAAVKMRRAWNAIITLSTVYRRVLLDAVVAPRRFKVTMPEFRRVSDILFHPGIASLQISQIPMAGESVQMVELDSGYGGMTPQDLYALLRVVRWIKPKRIFEIGTFNGVTTAHLALNSDAKIYTLDLPRESAVNLRGYSSRDLALLQPHEEIGKAYRRFNTDGRIEQLFGDSTTFDYRSFQGSMDLVIVDACHLFDYVMSDSRIAFDLLAEKGAIIWHDFGNALDVTRALRVLARRWPLFHIEGTWLAIYVRAASFGWKFGGRDNKRTESMTMVARGNPSC